MDNTEKVLEFLRLIAPRRTTNEEICARTGVRPHQQVYQITRKLCQSGEVHFIRAGKEWEFWVETKEPPMTPRPKVSDPATFYGTHTPQTPASSDDAFAKDLAQRIIAARTEQKNAESSLQNALTMVTQPLVTWVAALDRELSAQGLGSVEISEWGFFRGRCEISIEVSSPDSLFESICMTAASNAGIELNDRLFALPNDLSRLQQEIAQIIYRCLAGNPSK